MAVAVFIVANPGDETLSMGPAIVNHMSAGHLIYTVVCADGGNSGTWPEWYAGLSRDSFCAARQMEYILASGSLGASIMNCIRTSCPTTGYNGMLRDSTLNLGAQYEDNMDYAPLNIILKRCISPGYNGNYLGANNQYVNPYLYQGIKDQLSNLAIQTGSTPQQLLVKTHSHLDAHPDHRAVCQAVFRLYKEGFITNLRHYVSPAQWDSQVLYPSQGTSGTFPSAAQLSAIQEIPSGNYNRIPQAISKYVKMNSTTATGIAGTAQYGIGYLSDPGLFDKVSQRNCSYYHLPPEEDPGAGFYDSLLGTPVPGYNNYPSPVGRGFYKPNCTWYCWNRANYQTGKQLSFNSSANAYEWLDAVDTSNHICTVVKEKVTPVRNSIAVFEKKNVTPRSGHVLYIEYVGGGYVYFTESNFDAGMDGIFRRVTVSEFLGSSGNWRTNFNLLGYVQL
jgi:LmbE family N-acetylglucosaminyl deacetylase/surface antigen